MKEWEESQVEAKAKLFPKGKKRAGGLYYLQMGGKMRLQNCLVTGHIGGIDFFP